MAFTPISNLGKDARYLANSNGAALSTGVMTSASVYLSAGLTIKNISFVSATTAAGTPTHWAFAIYSSAATPALLGATADQVAGAWAANTLMTKALAVPAVIPKAGWYWVSCWMAATTVPTLVSLPAYAAGLLPSSGIQATDKPLAVTSGSALVATPATIVAGGTNSLVIPLCYVS